MAAKKGRRKKLSEEEKKELYKRVKELIMKITAYPVGVSLAEREKARRALVKLYKESEDDVKGSVMAYMNEKLSNAREYREFICLDYLKEKHRRPDVNPAEITSKILDFSTSADGAAYLLSILGEFDDALAVKMLTFYITRYMAHPFVVFRGLAMKAISVLGGMTCKAALHALADIKGLVKGLDLEGPVEASINMWRTRVDAGKVKLTQEEKRMLSSILKKKGGPEKDKVEYAQYR